MDIAEEYLCFLDLKKSILDKKLVTIGQSKSTDSHLYRQSTSFHKPKSIAAIQNGVTLRIRRICSSESEYLEKSREYMTDLAARDHSLEKVKSAFTGI